jgi:hypothetical protein
MVNNLQGAAMPGPHIPRNPFGVMDVPDPYGTDVLAFATNAKLDGLEDDENAQAWATIDEIEGPFIDGMWGIRWNGGADPTIPGDSPDKWKQGHGEMRAAGDRIYCLFDWDNGKRRGLIEAKREGATRLIGKYVNLSNPQITRPWIGLIVNPQRIDGRWTQGRLDFRR